MPKMQRNDSVELSSLFPQRPSNWPNSRKCRSKVTSVASDAPRVGTDEPWNVSESPKTNSPADARPSISPSPLRSVTVYGVPLYPRAGYPTSWRCLASPAPPMVMPGTSVPPDATATGRKKWRASSVPGDRPDLPHAARSRRLESQPTRGKNGSSEITHEPESFGYTILPNCVPNDEF